MITQATSSHIRMIKTSPERLEYNRQWRVENAEHDLARARARYLIRRENDLKRKRLYYQTVRKPKDKTEVGRFKDREKKSRRKNAGGKVAPAEWLAICAAFDNRCAYCGGRPSVLEMDHVVALSRGGKHIAENIVPACKPCNSSKGAR
jgi:5-methylcytosine-specific restriction endonuclease McrA